MQPPPQETTGSAELPAGLPNEGAPATQRGGTRVFWLLAAFVVVAAVLRLPLLDRPVWFDEACMSDQRIGTTAQLIATLYVDIHPPLFVTLMHLWNGWFGDGEVAMRMPALLSGLACIPLTWWTGRRLVGEHAALLAAALLVLSPVHVWYCDEARLYTPMVCCALLAFGTFDRLLQNDGAPRRWLFALHVTNVAVMLALHYYLAVIVLALACLAPLLARGFRNGALRIVVWHGVGIALLGGFVLVKRALGHFETSQDYLSRIDLPRLYHFVFEWAWTGSTWSTSETEALQLLGRVHVWLGIALLALGVVSLATRHRRHPRGWLVLVGVLLLPCFLFACAAVGLDSTYLERTLIPALPFVLLLGAAGVALLPGVARRVAAALALLFAASSLAGLYDGYDDRWTLYKPHPDWRSAARWLGDQIDSHGATGRAVYTSMPNPRSLSYYDERIQFEKNLTTPMSADEIRRKVGSRLGSWLGDVAGRQFEAFAAHNEALLQGAKLRIYPSQATPAELTRPPAPPDDICYVVRNQWHPNVSVDDTVERLLEDAHVEVLERVPFTGVTVHKVRIRP